MSPRVVGFCFGSRSPRSQTVLGLRRPGSARASPGRADRPAVGLEERVLDDERCPATALNVSDRCPRRTSRRRPAACSCCAPTRAPASTSIILNSWLRDAAHVRVRVRRRTNRRAGRARACAAGRRRTAALGSAAADDRLDVPLVRLRDRVLVRVEPALDLLALPLELEVGRRGTGAGRPRQLASRDARSRCGRSRASRWRRWSTGVERRARPLDRERLR